MAAAARRIARLKRIDRAAVGVITLGGVAVIVAVIGILVFIAAEAVPLFLSSSITARGTMTIERPVDRTAFAAIGTDEYRQYVHTIEPAGRVIFRRVTGGEPQAIDIQALNGATVTATSRSLLDGYLAAALSDGRVALMQLRITPVFTEQSVTDVSMDLADRGVVSVDPEGRPARQVSYLEQGDQKFVASLVGDTEIAYWWTSADGEERRAALRSEADDRFTHVRIGRDGNLIAGTTTGRVYHWEAGDAPALTDMPSASDTPVTALEWVLGGTSYVVGTADGSVSSWFRAPDAEDGSYVMVRAHEFEPQGSPVTSIAMSPRERSFATAGADGTIVLRHQTSNRWLADMRGTGAVDRMALTPRANGLLVQRGDRLETYDVSNPHPEISWHVLFGKVWYEGYAEPEYVWQSTGATDDFEAKFSFVPLVFGTIKATVYALLFAIPLAVLGALYTSQFVHPAIRNRIKPTVEIMAALPSVVIGFLAGLYLATVVERNLAAVALMLLLMPIFGTAGIFVWRLLPLAVARRFPAGTEVLLIVPMLLVGAAAALYAGPAVEAAWLGGDTRQWLLETFGVNYDQRNSLVVGLAMGFAVIPIIFTISEDAFSSVPSSLTAASLALGASRWQTATRVVLPTASPGVFSAIMIGFGRAVGETMIVLMATGNTPLLDWSPFNGMRTLSANIAVEVPEAPHGGTLYRTLFLAATLLFIMTFAVNTLAELIRQRLRERYRAV
jgi:phosphate transport system permease protein